MPTISHALLRDPSFPLIVPKAEWRTPQVNYSPSGAKPANVGRMTLMDMKRPRASSLQVPFMGGTIVPSHEIEHQVREMVKKRRNSLPAHHVMFER